VNDLQHLLTLLKERRSIREFTDRSVGRDTIENLIEAASWAPSASNRQDWLFVVVTDDTMKQRMAEAVRQRWHDIIEDNRGRGFIDEIEAYSSTFSDFGAAPVVIVVACRNADSLQKRLLGDDAAARLQQDAADSSAEAFLSAVALSMAGAKAENDRDTKRNFTGRRGGGAGRRG